MNLLAVFVVLLVVLGLVALILLGALLLAAVWLERHTDGPSVPGGRS